MGSREDATMIYWNDKERGYPIGLESGTKGIWISCTACKHSDKWLLIATGSDGTGEAFVRLWSISGLAS